MLAEDGEDKGFVCVVEQVDFEGLGVRLLDDQPQALWRVEGQELVGLIKTGKKAGDLAWWAGLKAERVEKERGWVDFERGYGAAPKSSRKKKEKSPEDLVAEALVRALGKAGKLDEVMQILEGGGE